MLKALVTGRPLHTGGIRSRSSSSRQRPESPSCCRSDMGGCSHRRSRSTAARRPSWRPTCPDRRRRGSRSKPAVTRTSPTSAVSRLPAASSCSAPTTSTRPFVVHGSGTSSATGRAHPNTGGNDLIGRTAQTSAKPSLPLGRGTRPSAGGPGVADRASFDSSHRLAVGSPALPGRVQGHPGLAHVRPGCPILGLGMYQNGETYGVRYGLAAMPTLLSRIGAAPDVLPLRLGLSRLP